MSLWLAVVGIAFATRPGFEDVPFFLGADGVEYLGWLTPEECPEDMRFPCDVVVVDPNTGYLVVWQRESATGVRHFSHGEWSLSDTAVYEWQAKTLLTVSDVWNRTIAYDYEGQYISMVDWSGERQIFVEYDRKGRVVTLSDDAHEWSFVWGKDAHHQALFNGQDSVEWFLHERGIRSRSATGTEVTLLLSDGVVSGWIDPRGFETHLETISNGWNVSHGGLRNWSVEHQSGTLTKVALEGSGAWNWRLDEDGRVKEIVDPTLKRIEVLRNNTQNVRLLRSNGFIDFTLNDHQQVLEVLDVSGRLIHLERDSLGYITEMEDAVGEKIVLEHTNDGKIKRLILRDGQEWNVEYGRDGMVRTIVQPDQVVWTFERDTLGYVIKVSKSFEEPIRISRTNGHWTRLEHADGHKFTAWRDSEGRLTRLQDAAGAEMHLVYDILGQIQQIQIADTKWTIERDTFGQVIGWNDISIQRGVWGTVRKTQVGTLSPWEWERDGTGRLTSLKAEEAWQIEYNGMGLPILWKRGELLQHVEYNHWGWTTKMENVWLKRDVRGAIRKVGLYDLEWRFKRDAAARVLILKGPYDLQLGFNYEIGHRRTQLRFPSGALQHHTHQGGDISHAYTNRNGQRVDVGTTITESGWNIPSVGTIEIEQALSDQIGVQTVPNEDDVHVVEYDSFYFMRQMCDLSSCLQVAYDARGRLQTVDDGSGLPVNLIWGWSGWAETPLLIGGTVAMYSADGLNIQTDGQNHQEYMYWKDGFHVLADGESLMMDSGFYYNDRLKLHGVPLEFQYGMASLSPSEQQLQRGFPWVDGQLESRLFERANSVSVWNQPIEMMIRMGMVESIPWMNSSSDHATFDWLSKSFGTPDFLWISGLMSTPVKEPPLESLLLMALLNGGADPDVREIFGVLVGDKMMTEIAFSSSFALDLK